MTVILDQRDATCPVCGDVAWTYRVATPEDQMTTPPGMAVTCTGPRHFAAHGCRGDHRPVDDTP